MKYTLRTIGSIVAISAAMIMATSCTKDKFAEDNLKMIPGVERYVSASASLPEMGGDTKAYVDPSDDGKVKWNTGDIININGTELTVTGAANNNTTAFFSGTVYAIPDGSDELYWAVYPSNLMPVTNSSTIHSDFEIRDIYFSFPSTQTYDASKNPLQNCAYMAGFARVPQGSSNLRFEMKNLGAVLCINLQPKAGETNTKITKLVFSSKKLTGRCRIDNEGWGLAPQDDEADNYNLVVNLTDGTHNYIDISGGATNVYVLLNPGDGSAFNLTMRVFNTDGHYAQITSSNMKLNRSTMYTSTIANITFNRGISVSANKVVDFAPGNLQWTYNGSHKIAGGGTATGRWRFAEHQWDYVGDATYGTVYIDAHTKSNNEDISSTYTGYIDLFGWATSGYHDASDPYNRFYYPYNNDYTTVDYYTNNYGYGPSTNMTDPDLVGTSANYDWGVYNAIQNLQLSLTENPGTWRTPTKDEWNYVINTRSTSSGIRYAKATVNDVPGLIIVPDNWSTSTYTLNSTNTSNAAYNTNVINAATWTTLEKAGCFFLPAGGCRQASYVDDPSEHGCYWSSTNTYSFNSYSFDFYSMGIDPQSYHARYEGLSVRLVRDLN